MPILKEPSPIPMPEKIKPLHLKRLPKYAQILTSGSVEAVNTANNHSHDYGEQSYTDTLTALDNAGITHFGYDDTAVIDIKGIKLVLSEFTS